MFQHPNVSSHVMGANLAFDQPHVARLQCAVDARKRGLESDAFIQLVWMVASEFEIRASGGFAD